MTTTALHQWKQEYEQGTREAIRRLEELTPEPLYESSLPTNGRLCLVCGKHPASSALRTPGQTEPIVPLCKHCSADWNCYGYSVLKRIKPLPLLVKMSGWFVRNPLGRARIWNDLRRLQQWQKKMAHIKKTLREQGR
jgi:hypothetical protein